MTLATFLPWALTTGAITIGAWIWIVQYERLKRRRALAAEARAAELEATRGAVSQLESRVEFAARLLEQEHRKDAAPR